MQTFALMKKYVDKAVKLGSGMTPAEVERLYSVMEQMQSNVDQSTEQVEAMSELIENKVDKQEGMVLVTQEDADKLSAMPTISELGDGLELQDGVLNVTTAGLDPDIEYTFSGGSI